MKNKTKNFIKHIIIYSSVFVLVFSSLCFSASAVSNDKYDFIFLYKPALQWYDESQGKWVDDTEPESLTYTCNTNGAVDKIIVRWIQNYDVGKELDANFNYRMFMRFKLSGSDVTTDSITFDVRIVKATGSLESGSYYNIDKFTFTDFKGSTSGLIGYRNSKNSITTDLAPTITDINYGFRYAFKPPIDKGDYKYDFHQASFGFSSSVNQHHLFIEISNFSSTVMYSEEDKSGIDNYTQQEDKILGDTQQGREQTKNIFKNITDFFLDKPQGVLSAGIIMRKFLSIPFFNTLTDISLAIGLFAFVVGMSMLLSKSSGGGGGQYKSPNNYKGKHEK